LSKKVYYLLKAVNKDSPVSSKASNILVAEHNSKFKYVSTSIHREPG
jgi:hypothetical protein